MVTRKLTDKQETERARGFIIYLLYLKKPHAFELNSLWRTMDEHNQPIGHRRFVEEVDYLRSLGLLRVFPSQSEKEITVVEQARLLQRFIETPMARDMGSFVYARITAAGINFQEGNSEVVGIERVE